MKLEERRSSSYWKRKEFLRENTVPTISEIKKHVGSSLAEVIFEEANEVQKDYLGLNSPLKGPSDCLWTSPSDLLIGKVCLKPPLTQKHVQALTHIGIMEIGAEIEQKYWNEMELEKKRAIEEETERLERVFDIEKRQLLNELETNMKKKYFDDMQELRDGFENKINQLVIECYIQVKQLESETEMEINSLNVNWQAKLDETVQKTVEKMTEEFLEKIRLQERVLVETFKKEINNLKIKHKSTLDLKKIKCKELVLQIRHNLECRNVANLMYVLCKERKKCKGEKDALEEYYLSQIRKNKKQIKTQSKKIRKLTCIKNKKQKQLATRERILIEILRQFQKFIYYALKASPTQGEFLLNINKLIKFELDDYCTKEKKVEVKTVKTPSEISVRKSEVMEDITHYLESQFVDDVPEEEEESDVLPAFFFDEKLYIREDFRDRFSAGIEMDRNHPLWNQDVEELLNVFRKSMAEKRNFDSSSCYKLKPHASSVHFNQETQSQQIKEPEPSSDTLISDMNFEQRSKASSTEVVEREIKKVSMTTDSLPFKPDKKFKKPKGRDRVSIVATSPTISETRSYDIRPNLEFQETRSKLELARDSVILHISSLEKKSLQKIAETSSNLGTKASTISPEEEQLQESFIFDDSDKNNRSDAESVRSVSGKADSQVHGTSKLVLAQDSLELIRSSLAILPRAKDDEEKQVKKKQVKVVKKQKVTKCRKSKTKSREVTVKVAGEKGSKEHEKTEEVFTEERINSLVNLMKTSPSLIRLFTACSR